MCWPKADPTPLPRPPTTTTKTTMAMAMTATTLDPVTTSMDCPPTENKCDDKVFCVNGLCCLPLTGGNKHCVCFSGYTGIHCQQFKVGALESTDEMQSTGFVAAFGGFLGVAVIILFVALILLRVKCRKRYRLRQRAPNKRVADRDEDLSCSVYAGNGGGAGRGGEEEEGGGEVGEDNTTHQHTGIQETDENCNKEKTVSDQKTEDTVK